MSLVFDRRSDLGENPGTHGLVVGISSYPHLPGGSGPPAPTNFGLGQLSSAALTAYRIYEWLLDRKERLAAPLATCRLLLSPSEQELTSEAALSEVGAPATLNNFLRAATDWRSDAASNADSLTFVYLVGHGAELSRQIQVLFLEDFGDGIGPLLRNTANVATIFNGMAPSSRQPSIARRQVYFIDSGRPRLTDAQDADLLYATPVFDTELSGIDDRRTMLIYAAARGGQAYAIPGKSTLFGEALLDCLNGQAGEVTDEGEWAVKSMSLVPALDVRMRDFSAQYGIDLPFHADTTGGEFVIHYLDEPPVVEIDIQLTPEEAVADAVLELRDESGNVVWRASNPLPPAELRLHVPAGFYSLGVSISGNRFGELPPRWRRVTPPRVVWRVDLRLS